MHHPVVGDLELIYEAMELPSDPGFTILAFLPESSSPSADTLVLLASWAATQSACDAVSHDGVRDEV